MKLSVIIPAFNEEDTIDQCLRSIVHSGVDAEVIVVDGGSTDETVAKSMSLGAKVIHCVKGRGAQMNRGAAITSGGLLLFLHADTVLPEGALSWVCNLSSRESFRVGVFRARFFPETPVLRFYSFFTRFATRFTMFGDQGIVARKDFFDQINGYPDWPLFEDIRFLEKAGRHANIERFPIEVETSARKFLHNGPIRQQLRNCFYLLSYHFGVSPEYLAGRYYRNETKDNGTLDQRSPQEARNKALSYKTCLPLSQTESDSS